MLKRACSISERAVTFITVSQRNALNCKRSIVLTHRSIRLTVTAHVCGQVDFTHSPVANETGGAHNSACLVNGLFRLGFGLDQQKHFNVTISDSEIGRASCRERVCRYVSILVVAVSLKKKKT